MCNRTWRWPQLHHPRCGDLRECPGCRCLGRRGRGVRRILRAEAAPRTRGRRPAWHLMASRHRRRRSRLDLYRLRHRLGTRRLARHRPARRFRPHVVADSRRPEYRLRTRRFQPRAAADSRRLVRHRRKTLRFRPHIATDKRRQVRHSQWQRRCRRTSEGTLRQARRCLQRRLQWCLAMVSRRPRRQLRLQSWSQCRHRRRHRCRCHWLSRCHRSRPSSSCRM
mmetsp:Transcript_44734/g.123974  ORF Transcript_44734/g.123974 Transcript_44734/m.123974 type:complete len:223 (-) Transcript_44734:823-1491(-)